MATGTLTEQAVPQSRGRRRLRRLANGLIGLGLAVIVYAAVILAWGDPFTWVWSHWQQRALSGELSKLQTEYSSRAYPTDDRAALAQVRAEATGFAHHVHEGHAFGRLVIGRIGLSVVTVQGTDRYSDLGKGPGHYLNTSFPGQGATVAIAGHRTTFGAWFRHIDEIRDGDFIELQMPYATFSYRVQYHKVVDAGDWTIIRPHGYDRLVLSACHPLYSADQRWVVFAKAVSVKLPGGRVIQL